jgi:hypothetical protein
LTGSLSSNHPTHDLPPAADHPLYPVVPGGERQRDWAFRAGVNIVMYALTGNYKADLVHMPALLERLGQ